MAEAPADFPRLALTHHEEKKRRREYVIGPAVDENHIVISAQLSPQMGRRHDSAATTAQNHNPLASVKVRHVLGR
jgi:hypothetical protein